MSGTVTDALSTIQRIQGTFDTIAPASKTAAAEKSSAMFAALVQALQVSQESAPGSSTSGESIVDAAETYEGVPYVFGGTSRDGIDCTGLVQQALADAGIDVGRSMDAQMTAGTEVDSLAEAQPGDLIVLDGGAHIVIYSGDGKVIHAPYEGRTVTEQDVWFDESDIVTIRRVAPDAAPADTVATPALESLQALINAQSALLTRSVS